MSFTLRDAAGVAAAALSAYGRPPVEEAALVNRIVAVAIYSFLAVSFGLAAIVCGAIAFWTFAVPYLGSLGAILVIAGVFLVACLVLAWVAYTQTRSKPKPPIPAISPQSAEQLLAQGLQIFKEHKGAVLMAALVAGMMTGNAERR